MSALWNLTVFDVKLCVCLWNFNKHFYFHCNPVFLAQEYLARPYPDGTFTSQPLFLVWVTDTFQYPLCLNLYIKNFSYSIIAPSSHNIYPSMVCSCCYFRWKPCYQLCTKRCSDRSVKGKGRHFSSKLPDFSANFKWMAAHPVSAPSFVLGIFKAASDSDPHSEHPLDHRKWLNSSKGKVIQGKKKEWKA